MRMRQHSMSCEITAICIVVDQAALRHTSHSDGDADPDGKVSLSRLGVRLTLILCIIV